MSAIPGDFDDLDISNDTKMILNELVKRKKKYDQVKAQYAAVVICGIVVGVFVLSWLFRLKSATIQNALSVLSMSMSAVYIAMLAGLFLSARNLAAQYKKRKKKYEDLREETIDLLNADWKLNLKTNKRDKISERLSEKGINIRYKS
ncbi:DUF2663 family protein [Cohnella pontilimi]|nr:DUF2663 family protein [Cohnella pontilimi]